MTSPTAGIQCDEGQVYGNTHPHVVKRGNLLYTMLFSLTFKLIITNGLWCDSTSECSFDSGGLFITTTARKVLFNGYSDPSYLKYYNMKLKNKGISFSCAENAYDQCGIENYKCNDAGIIMNLPNGKTYKISINSTQVDQYFAPYLEVAETGELLWPYSMEPSDVERANAVKSDPSVQWVEKIINPYYALYPSWDGRNDSFNQFIQCQKRVFGGNPGKFASCYRSRKTGRKNIREKDKITIFMGNTSIKYLPDESKNVSYLNVRGYLSMQQPLMGWEGFTTYPYIYNGKLVGSDINLLKEVTIFEEQLGLGYTLDQNELDIFERTLPASIPFQEGLDGSGSTKSSSLTFRRFIESKEVHIFFLFLFYSYVVSLIHILILFCIFYATTALDKVSISRAAVRFIRNAI